MRAGRRRVATRAGAAFVASLIVSGTLPAFGEIVSLVDVETSQFHTSGDAYDVFIAVRQSRTRGSLRLTCHLSQVDGTTGVFDERIYFPGSQYNFQTIRFARDRIKILYGGPEPRLECRTGEEDLRESNAQNLKIGSLSVELRSGRGTPAARSLKWECGRCSSPTSHPRTCRWTREP